MAKMLNGDKDGDGCVAVGDAARCPVVVSIQPPTPHHASSTSSTAATAAACPPFWDPSLVCQRLEALIQPLVANGGVVPSRSARTNLARIVFLRQGVPTAGTVGLCCLGSLLFVATSTSTATAANHRMYQRGYILSCVALLVLFCAYSLLQFQLLMARSTAMHRRAAWRIQTVVAKWKASIAAAQGAARLVDGATTTWSGDGMSNWVTRAGVDHEILSARSLRLMVCRTAASSPVVRLLPKCVVPTRGGQRWDSVHLRWEAFREASDTCKLVDAMRIVMERDAVKLKPLTNLARPPRLPNLRMASLLGAEEVIESTDDSDGERVNRSVIGGMSTTSMPHRAEFFTLRLLTLLWLVGTVLLIVVGVVRWAWSSSADGAHKRSFAVEALLLPALSMMGLIPHNALVVNRALYLRNNATLDISVQQWIRSWGSGMKPLWGTGLPSSRHLSLFPWHRLLHMVWQGLFQNQHGLRDVPVFLARSTVETLGTVTAVAALDSAGVLTDLVALPVRLMVIRENRWGGSSSGSSSSDEDERMYLTQKSLEATKQRKRDMRMQVRRKRFQEERFTEMELRPCCTVANSNQQQQQASPSSPPPPPPSLSTGTGGTGGVEFANAQECVANAQSINPVCLAILLHATVSASSTAESAVPKWLESMQLVERASSWARSLLWVARAAGFHDDSIVTNFRVLARIVSVRSGIKGNCDSVGGSSYPDQDCSLVCVDRGGQAHVFSIGTIRLVIERCASYWTGLETEEFDDHEKAEVTFFAEKQWSGAQGMEPVAVAHRVLPDRYQRFVRILAAEVESRGGALVEKLFVNEKEVRSSTDLSEAGAVSRHGGAASGAALRRQCSAEQLSDAHGGGSLLDGATPLDSTMRPSELTGGVNGNSVLPTGLRMRRTLSHGDVPTYHSGPIDADAALTVDSFARYMCSTNLTMLGLVALRESLRPDVESVIEALGDAGIRFMHFGSGSEQRTKAFGGRLGLETDWNTCISLKAESVALDQHSIRAQLPFGIPSIRKHIIYVDPIPLQVSLFSHARGVATRSMIAVLQDNHEVVLALGSTCNHANTRTFVQADYAIGVQPSRGPEGADPATAPGTDGSGTDALHDVAALLSAACSMDVGRCPNVLPIVFQLIAESRQMLSAMSSCNEFMLHANLFVVCTLTGWFFLGLPHFLTPGGIIFLLNVLVPLLGFACNNHHRLGVDPMQLKQSKQHFDHRWCMFRHSAVVFALRYIPTILWTVVLSLLLVNLWCKPTSYSAWMLGQSDLSVEQEACLEDVRSILFYVVVLYLLAHSLVHLSRYESPSLLTCTLPSFGHRSTLDGNGSGGGTGGGAGGATERGDDRHGGPLDNRRSATRVLLKSSHRSAYFDVWRCTPGWFLLAFAAALVSLVFEVLDHHPLESYHPNGALPQELLLIAVAASYPMLVIALDRPLKRWRLRRYADMQKFRTLSYGTRLGMHSPRGDYEPSEDDEDPTDTAAAPMGGGVDRGQHGESHADIGMSGTAETVVTRGRSTTTTGVTTTTTTNSGTTTTTGGGVHHQPPLHGVSFESHPPASPYALNYGTVGVARLRRRLREFLFRWCSVASGSLERHCVCCDQVGGHPAQYCKS